jgi:hypothetical protein
MRVLLLISFMLVFSLAVNAQEERDTVYKRCPVFITDTVSQNNFFLEGMAATVKVFRVKGKLTVVVQQRDQYFTLFFHDKHLKSGKYKMFVGAKKGNEVEAKYSFRSGQQVSYVDVSSGTVEASFDKEKDLWHLKVAGLMANLVERSVTYYRVRSDLYFH